MATSVSDLLAATTLVSGQISALQSDVTAFIAAEGVLPDLSPVLTAIQTLGASVTGIDAAVKAATPVSTTP